MCVCVRVCVCVCVCLERGRGCLDPVLCSVAFVRVGTSVCMREFM